MVHFFNWLSNLTSLLLAPCPLADFGETAATRSFCFSKDHFANVRSWHKADIEELPANVRFRG